MKKKIIGVVILVLAVAAGLFYYRGRNPGVGSTIRVSGNIEITDAEVGFKIPGRVEARLVAEGEMVKAGQIVARLEAREWREEVALRRAQVRSTQAVLDELLAGSRTEEIGQARAALERTRADRERARLEWERQQKLYQREVISTREFDFAKNALDAAEAKVKEAAEFLTLVEKGPRREKIDQARATLEASRQALAQAETRLGYTVLEAPLTGVVLSKNIEPGEYVSPGTPVITVGDLAQVWVRAYINETELGKVKVGQKVRVTVDTFPGKQYRGPDFLHGLPVRIYAEKYSDPERTGQTGLPN